MTPENYLRQEQWKAATQWARATELPLPLYRGTGAFNGLGESILSPTGSTATRTPVPPPGKKDKQT